MSSSRLQFALLYLAIALAWCWPLPLHLTNRLTPDPGDPLLVTYLMWWNAHAVPLTRAYWNAPFFWPLSGALALTEHLAGLSPLTTPLQWLGATPLLAYNLTFIAAAWWTALATHALVERLTGHRMAAFCAALAFTYCPYRISQTGHLQMIACWWIPLALLALHRFVEDGRRRWLLLLGVSWLLQGLTNGYTLFFLPILFAIWGACFLPWRRNPARVVAIGATLLVFSLPIVPFLLEYYRVQTALGLSRTRPEMIFFSADTGSFTAATELLRFWRTHAARTAEVFLFPGITALLLVVAALIAGLRSRAFLFYMAAAILMAAFCLGPTEGGMTWASLWHPFDAVAWLPGFSGLRVPARFFLLAALCLAVGAGLAFAYLAARTRHPRILLAFVIAGLIVDGTPRLPLVAPPGRLGFGERDARILALPFDNIALTIRSMYQSMTHRMPLVNGYAGYFPPHVNVINWALGRRDPTLIASLHRGRPLFIVVAETDTGDDWNAFAASQPGAEMVGISGVGRVYRLPPAPFEKVYAETATLAGVAITRTPEFLVCDAGRARPLRGIELKTYGYLPQLPETLHIEVSEDGATWRTVHEERPGGAALAGVLREPHMIPLRLRFDEVTIRYLRINTPLFEPADLIVLGG